MLKKADLYLILDTDVCGYDRLFEILRQAVSAGVGIVQLRDKNGMARDTFAFARQAVKFLNGRIPFIVNDRVDIAVAAKASGVHLGQDDIPVPVARRILGNKYLIGASCQTLAHALKIEREGADYIGFGSVFKTLTKPHRSPMEIGLLKKVSARINIPVYAIGGISVQNASEVMALGITRVAVCRDICLSPHIKKTVRQFKEILSSSHF